MGTTDKEFIFAKLLAATEDPSFQRLTLYLPDKDKNGKNVLKLKEWLRKAREILTVIGGGATALPPADGTWMNPDNDEIVWEKTTIIYTFIEPDRFEENISTLRTFLHSFGRQTNQGEVVF